MKIGILTHHWVPNFGANLQALATVSLLQSLGHEVQLIDYRPKELIELYKKKINRTQLEIHESFQQEFLASTKVCYNLSEVDQVNKNEKYDILISGSDAVFRLDYSKNREDTTFPNPFWLTFAKETQKKLFFSVSSMGTNFTVLDKDTKQGIITTLRGAEIYVRDKWTKEGLNELDNTLKIEQTVDPVFLLNKYLDIPEKYEYKSEEKYILFNIYKGMVSDKWINSFVEKANNKGFKVILVPNPEGNFFGKEYVNETVDFPIHPLTWYSMIQNSSGYFGVRFHPVVTSISNDIPFIALDNYQKGYFNRFSSKTFDISYKTGNQKYCLEKVRRRLLTPSKAIRWLTEERPNTGFVKKEVERIETIFKKLGN